jgi:DNA-binding NtrC family response regulator
VKTLHSVLIVDDDINLRRSLALIIQHSGYQVTQAGNLPEVWSALKASNFSVVLLDLKMPDVNGLDLLPSILQMYPAMRVVILTAHAALESAIDAIQKGACDYLLKPIGPQDLILKLESILSDPDRVKHRKHILEELQKQRLDPED